MRSLPGSGYWSRFGWWAWRRRPRGDRGTAAIELAIVTPVVIVLLLTVVALGRYSYGKVDIEQASAAAARAASLTSSPGQAAAAAQQAAHDSLDGSGVSCTNMAVSIDTGSFRPGGIVSVTLSCTADLSSLALAGVPGAVTVARTSTAPLETYRQFGGTG
jgi:Flp pilus assembly protein TadG